MENDADTNSPEDRHFCPWRIPITDRSRGIVDEAIGMLQNYEKYHKKRQRKRRPADQHVFEAAVTAVLCEVMYQHLIGHHTGVCVTRSNQVLGRQSRYRHPALGKTFPSILDMMTAPEMAFIEQEIGHQGHFGQAKRTTIKPGWRTLDRIHQHSLALAELGLSDQEEIIILRRVKKAFWDEGGNQEYIDTQSTRTMRSQMAGINEWLASAAIAFDGTVIDDNNITVDLRDRRMRRIFTRGRFDSGGRLFGGFWQSLAKRYRRAGLILDGEQAVELDYGQMNPRIIYGLAGSQPPRSDLYMIPGFEEYRSGIKKLINSMMFATKPLSRMPRGARGAFADSHSIDQVTTAIEHAHPDIASKFYTGIGHDAQFIESEILLDVLEKLKEQSILALPIHDAVMVPQSKADSVKEVMLDAFHRHTGVEGEVSTVVG